VRETRENDESEEAESEQRTRASGERERAANESERRTRASGTPTRKRDARRGVRGDHAVIGAPLGNYEVVDRFVVRRRLDERTVDETTCVRWTS